MISKLHHRRKRYTNADFKLCLYVWVHIKIMHEYTENFIFWILRILELFTGKVWWWWWWWIVFVVWLTDERRSLISSRDHCQRSSPSRISNPPRAGFDPAQNLSWGLLEWSCAVVITTAPRRHVWEMFVYKHIYKQ